MRQNIILDKSAYDRDWYKEVINAAALTEDLEALVSGVCPATGMPAAIVRSLTCWVLSTVPAGDHTGAAATYSPSTQHVSLPCVCVLRGRGCVVLCCVVEQRSESEASISAAARNSASAWREHCTTAMPMRTWQTLPSSNSRPCL